MARKEIVDYVTGLGISILDKEARETRNEENVHQPKSLVCTISAGTDA